MTFKIIYVSFSKLTAKIERDWFIDFCIKNGVNVEFWDISSLMRPGYDEAHQISPPYLRQVQNFRIFEELIALPENSEALYVMLLSYSAKFNAPFRLLSKNNSKMVFINWGYMPTTTAAIPGWKSRFTRLIASPLRFLSSVPEIALGKLYRHLGLIKKFDLVFAAGNVLMESDLYTKQVIPINLCDYDQYQLEVSNGTRVALTERYAVFLDTNLPYQSDLALCGLGVIDGPSYFRSLNLFFDRLEAHYNLKVVIALHPKSGYGSEVFGGREVYGLKTANLVRHAEFAITHTSTAISYAVLNNKPILFIYTNEMLEVYKNNVILEINSLSSYFNSSPINIDTFSKKSSIEIPKIDMRQYQSYRYSYLTSQASEDEFSPNIFLKNMQKLALCKT